MSGENLAPLVDRLRGKVILAVNDGCGPLNGSDYFERSFPASKQAMEAADVIEQLCAALDPLARLSVPRKPQGNAAPYSIRFSDIERAAAALRKARGEP